MKLTGLVAGLMACAAAMPAQAAIVFGVDDTNNLVRFDSASPGTFQSSIAITGITDSIQAIDFRPANGVLYALGGDRVLYTINTTTGVATALGGPLAIEGTFFGFDFNPVADAIRIVSNTNQNYRANPNTGALIAQDTSVFYPGAPNQDPDVVANAYLSGSTTQFAIDTAADTLVRQNNNFGDLTTIGSLGFNLGSRASFDIVGSDALVYGGTTLYSANLNTGALTRIGNTPGVLYGIAIAATPAVPEPATWAMLVAGFGALGATLRRRSAARVTYA